MLRFLVFVLSLCASSAFALSPQAEQALNSVQTCTPNTSFSCVVAGNCTKAQFCAACSDVASANLKQCAAKDKTYTAVEGLFGYLDGACKDVCGQARPGQVVSAPGQKAGDRVLVLSNSAGAVISGQKVSLGAAAFGGSPPTGSLVTAPSDAVAPEIKGAYACVKGKNDSTTNACLVKPGLCNEKKLSKANKCKVCNVVKTCSDGKAFVEGFFDVSCAGC